MRPPGRFLRFVLASAALHVLALLLVTQVEWAPPPARRPLMVRVIPLEPPAPAPPAVSRSEPPRPRTAATPPSAARPEAAARPTPAPRATPRPTPAPRATPARPRAGQVVELPDRLRPGERPERPREDTRFLSERDRTVERQTRARQQPGPIDRAPGAPGSPEGTRDTGPTEPPVAARPGAQPETPARRAEPAPRAEPPRTAEAPRPTPPPTPQVAEAPRPVPLPAPQVAEAPRPAPPPAPQTAEAPRRTPTPQRPETGATPGSPAPGSTPSVVARVDPPRPAPPPAPAAPRPQPDEAPRDLPPAGQPGTTSRARTSPDPRRRDDADGDGQAPPRPLPGLDRLLPTPGRIAQASPTDQPGRRGAGGQGGTVMRDYLPGLEEGDETFLNSREFRYMYYFRHVRNAIVPHWAPVAAIQKAYGTTTVSLPPESTSVVAFVIEKDGRISGVELVQRSGVQPLDGEAARAIRAAGQLPAPPAGLLDPDGRVVVGFSFTLTTGGSQITFGAPNTDDLRNLFRRPRLR